MNIQDALETFEKARAALNEAIQPRLKSISEVEPSYWNQEGATIPDLFGHEWTMLRKSNYNDWDPAGDVSVETKLLKMSDEDFTRWIIEQRAEAEAAEFEDAKWRVEQLEKDLEFARERFKKLNEKRK